jgi:hypothetical protein
MSNLVWKRAPHAGDEYALVVVNPDAIDIANLKDLLARVKRATGASGKRMLNKQASAAFECWLADVSNPLPSHAYARLSNWFLTEKRNDCGSPLAEHCAVLWDALFRCQPHKRLTHVDDNAQIVDITFTVWWKSQEDRQSHHLCRNTRSD